MRILALPGDGVGPHVVDAAVRVLDELAPDVETETAPIGRDVLATHDHPLGPPAREALARDPDGVLFGATETRPGEPSAVLTLREEVGARLSLRPSGHLDPDAGTVTVYRELTEGLYASQGERQEQRAREERTISEPATRAFAHLALDRIPADETPTVAHKATVLDATDGLFVDTVQAVADERGRSIDERLVDALAHDLAHEPEASRAILAPNLYGDVLSDLAAGLHGGLGTAASLTLGEGPPLAEPVHGTAPDIPPEQANPTATLASLALLLDELDRSREARTLERGLRRTLADPEACTPDLGGPATTRQMTDHVLATLEEVPA